MTVPLAASNRNFARTLFRTLETFLQVADAFFTVFLKDLKGINEQEASTQNWRRLTRVREDQLLVSARAARLWLNTLCWLWLNTLSWLSGAQQQVGLHLGKDLVSTKQAHDASGVYVWCRTTLIFPSILEANWWKSTWLVGCYASSKWY